MKIIILFLVLISFNVLSKVVTFTSNNARGVWYAENRIRLTLPAHLNVNGGFFYVLKNSDSNISIPLSILTAYDRKVDFEVPSLTQQALLKLLTGHLSILTTNSAGDVFDETSIQLAGILDQRFFYPKNDLGVTFNNDQTINMKLWAPTASEVNIHLFKNSDATDADQVLPLSKDLNGVWTTQINSNFKNYFYLYEVSVFTPATGRTETNLVTDPYSKSLSINSLKSQIVNVNDVSLKPYSWDKLQKNNRGTKIIYETHIRDLTSADYGIDEKERGTFLGLTRSNSMARNHLKQLADNGLTYIHFLPLNDFASVNENRSTWQNIDLNLKFENASDKPQTLLNRIRNVDSFNWGYDPYHYFVPDGSYSQNPDGSSRIRELRTMIQSLNEIGLKVIIDVVFNHTYSSGNDQFSVLNKIVPLYFYRLNENGDVYNSSCCSDTASENKMMEKLMIDAVVYWAKTYKVDGFRFDLMAFHTRENILNIKNELAKLTLQNDGVDGKNIYIYGEGWSFGSLYEQRPDLSFNQLNSYGSGVGFFNDRFRDAIRGGTTDSTEKSDQGFVTGLYTDFNQEIANRNTPTSLNDQKDKLGFLGDVIKIGLAGNLRDFQFKNSKGSISTASNYFYRGVPVGYSKTTDENVNYVSAHDGYSLFDAISAKAPFYTNGRNPTLASTHDKQRMIQIATGMTLLSQGVPFIEGGSEILRSKSGDVDSYDSGDWFNHLNWDYSDNNWGKGLPPSFKNYNDWSFWYPRLNDENMKPSKEDILNNLNIFKALMKIRQSTKLFTANTLDQVNQTMKFIDNDKDSNSGLIAYSLANENEKLIVIFNVNREKYEFKHPLIDQSWSLHKFLDSKVDDALKDVVINQGSITIPGRSVVVLVPNWNVRK